MITEGTNNSQWMNEQTPQAGLWKLGEFHKSFCGRMSLAPQSLISGWHVIIFSNAPWVLPGSSALHCKCLALVLSLALKHSWFTYSLFIAFWALSPGSSALGWTGFSCSSWNIVMYLSAGRLHLQWAGLTWCGLEKKKWKYAPCIWFLSSWESSDIQECFLHWKWFPNEWFHFSLCTEKLARPRDYTTETTQSLWDSPLFGSCIWAELQTHRFSTCKPETTALTARGS